MNLQKYYLDIITQELSAILEKAPSEHMYKRINESLYLQKLY